VVFILVSAYLFFSPVSGLLALSFLFGLIILLTGIAELLRSYRDHGPGNRGWHLFIGLIDLLIGLILLSHLAASLVIIRFIVGFYFLFRGISLLSFSRVGRRSWWVVIGGLLVVIVAVLVMVNPLFGNATLLIWLELAFFVTGLLNVMLGLRLKPAY
jgi:uncharacterized membrane protein HdeD (DUF308 family)